jgi:hypothetical protein
LASADLQIIGGDFNFDPERDNLPVPSGWTDCCCGNTDPTFDAGNEREREKRIVCFLIVFLELNPTAAITSKSGKRRRYDRLLVSENITPAHYCISGTQRSVQISSEVKTKQIKSNQIKFVTLFRRRFYVLRITTVSTLR